MIAHFEHVSDNRIHVRIFDVDAPTKYAQVLFEKEQPYQGSMVIRLKRKNAWVELATGAFDFKVYKQLRDYLFNVVKLNEVAWKGNGRIQKHGRKKTEMNRFLISLVVGVFMVAGGSVFADTIDDYMRAEGDYWTKGTPNDHQRYVAVCGVYRTDSDERPLAVINVDSYQGKNKITGTAADNQVVVETITNDLDYVTGALAVSNLCAGIQKSITERIGNALSVGSESAGKAIPYLMTGETAQ